MSRHGSQSSTLFLKSTLNRLIKTNPGQGSQSCHLHEGSECRFPAGEDQSRSRSADLLPARRTDEESVCLSRERTGELQCSWQTHQTKTLARTPNQCMYRVAYPRILWLWLDLRNAVWSRPCKKKSPIGCSPAQGPGAFPPCMKQTVHLHEWIPDMLSCVWCLAGHRILVQCYQGDTLGIPPEETPHSSW